MTDCRLFVQSAVFLPYFINFYMTLTIKQIKETCLYVEDLEKTQHFYNELLGLPVISVVPNRHVFFQAGSSVLLCFLAEVTKFDTKMPPHFGHGNMHFAFEVPNEEYYLWKESIIAKDILVEQEVEWRNGLLSFYFRDPDNHCLEVVMEGIWD